MRRPPNTARQRHPHSIDGILHMQNPKPAPPQYSGHRSGFGPRRSSVTLLSWDTTRLLRLTQSATNTHTHHHQHRTNASCRCCARQTRHVPAISTAGSGRNGRSTNGPESQECEAGGSPKELRCLSSPLYSEHCQRRLIPSQ